MIQLKRFLPVNGGQFWDKSDTPVIFPLTNLDLTRYVPKRQPTGNEDLDDPRTQIGPFKYDLYGVSNHMGTLSSGHCELGLPVVKGDLQLTRPPQTRRSSRAATSGSSARTAASPRRPSRTS